ncbi:SIMPL domain-containing protein [Pseudomonas stutzeri]|nr:SIMPL domain-containing protein [Stutzerimonas stutzeri]
MIPLSRCAPLLALAAALWLSPAQAEEPRYNQVGLRAEVGREVAHDRMHLILYAEAQHSDPGRLAAQITETLNRAVQRARAVKGVEVSLGNRYSNPLHDDKGRRIVAWRERAELRLESADFAALASLGAGLLDELQMAGMHFSLSPAGRRQHEEQLLKDAVAAFRERAQLVSEAMGGRSYRVVRLDLHSGAGMRPPLLRGMAAKTMSMDSAPVPEIEGGSSELTVNADGVIEVQLP